MTTIAQLSGACGICKIDESLRLVIGWASASTVNGRALIDKQNEIVPVDELVTAALEFMEGDRPVLLAHAGGEVGKVVFALPLTDDIAKSLGLSSRMEGLIVGVRIADPATFSLVAAGGLSGFSIGGHADKEAA